LKQLLRRRDGQLVPVSWDEAMAKIPKYKVCAVKMEKLAA
jgi:hypothetical protein